MSIFGVLAQFSTVEELVEVAKKMRNLGYRKWDAHSPYPIHGMNEAMGLKPSKLGYVSFIFGLLGASGAFLLQYWVAVIAYPLVISGKPLNSYPAFMPITFEGGILFAALGTVFGMFIFNRLPRWYHGLFRSEAFKKVTDDAFFISVESVDPQFNEKILQDFFQKNNAIHIEVIEE